MKKILFLIAILAYSLIAYSQEAKNGADFGKLKPVSLNKISKAYMYDGEETKKESSEDKKQTSGSQPINSSGYNLTPDSIIAKEKHEKSIESKYTKDILWTDASTWISTAFNNSNAVIDLKDKELGRIIIKGNAILPITELYSVEKGFTKFIFNFTIQIDCKNNKYRYIISNRSVTNTPMRGENLNYLSKESLTTIMNQLKDIVEITNNHFGGSTTWEINNKWNPIKDWQLHYNFKLKDILSRCCDIERGLVSSLEKSMLINDEW